MPKIREDILRPFPRMGNKARVMPILLDAMPKHNTIYDLFGGTGLVGLNAWTHGKCKHIVYNEPYKPQYEINEYFKQNKYDRNTREYPKQIVDKTLLDYENDIYDREMLFSLQILGKGTLDATIIKNATRTPNNTQYIIDRDEKFFTSWYEAQPECYNTSYIELIGKATKDDLVFLDPPYLNKAGYLQGKWTREREAILYAYCCELDHRGVKFMLTENHDDTFLIDLWRDYNSTLICDGYYNMHNISKECNSKHPKRREVLITNY